MLEFLFNEIAGLQLVKLQWDCHHGIKLLRTMALSPIGLWMILLHNLNFPLLTVTPSGFEKVRYLSFQNFSKIYYSSFLAAFNYFTFYFSELNDSWFNWSRCIFLLTVILVSLGKFNPSLGTFKSYFSLILNELFY